MKAYYLKELSKCKIEIKKYIQLLKAAAFSNRNLESVNKIDLQISFEDLNKSKDLWDLESVLEKNSRTN